MKLSGWGRYPRINARGTFFENLEEAGALVTAKKSWIAHGAGRSYGDSALNHDVIFTRRFNKLIGFDDQQGVIHCDAGMTLAEIISLVLPRGWFLKVTPGTQLITVGGAIASDVHGKNHHQAGCFSSSILSLRLMMPDRRIITCSRNENPDLFRATCGGMGLTGLIVDAGIQLQPVNSAFVRVKPIGCDNLEEVVEQFEAYQDWPYSIAWIDCLGLEGGQKLGRGLVTLGEHATDGDLSRPSRFSPTVPRNFPSLTVNRYSVSLFNELYFLIKGRFKTTIQRAPLDRFFYPLDGIVAWNRIYGSSGFMQYQFVIPEEAGCEGLRTVLKRMTDQGYGAFLGVLKRFGPDNDNMLSFPRCGYALALDFKLNPRLFPFLEELDAIVLDYGGRHYLAKDARLKPEVFEQGYSGIADFRTIRQQYGLSDKINSLQSRRLKI